ncbi:hypothetical protein QT196_38885 (plasmid) [Streptomyces sp. P9-2B-2]|uniref:hypothetical protein n=1 Tax=Streptomyces sp. P9-2B-2 TaxID=3057114 RepID=UPI0025B35EB4|nr:hypothetical protein [Streptomyces sp. P9-2B-2]WJY43230.1 hypothetical protein QT196_38885 [Streptomyces sp. P9-2B-2]
MRRTELEALRAAAATGEVDNQEAAKLAEELDAIREDRNQLLGQRAELQNRVQDLEKDLATAQTEYEHLQDEADNSANSADRLRSQLRTRDEGMTRLQAELADARHGECEVYVLQSKGAPINAARSKQGAIKAAEIFGVPPEDWKPSDGTRTDGWTITQIQLVAGAPQAIPSQASRQ